MSYQTTHQRTKGLHREFSRCGKQTIIIDCAEVEPGTFEVMTILEGGGEIAAETVATPVAAESIFNRMVSEVEAQIAAEAKPKPLKGKYAQLRDDLKRAMEAGRKAEEANREDGGACNFDAPELYLHRYTARLVKQAADEAGCGCFIHESYNVRSFVFSPHSNGQANARSRNAEAMAAALRLLGYDASMHYQLD